MQGTIRDFKDLLVWQRSMDLVVPIYRATASLPRDGLFGLNAQMRRAVISVPSNIAEGYRRHRTGHYAYHLCIAHGSIGELETQILACERIGYMKDQSASLLDEVDQLSRMLNVLISKIQQ